MSPALPAGNLGLIKYRNCSPDLGFGGQASGDIYAIYLSVTGEGGGGALGSVFCEDGSLIGRQEDPLISHCTVPE